MIGKPSSREYYICLYHILDYIALFLIVPKSSLNNESRH